MRARGVDVKWYEVLGSLFEWYGGLGSGCEVV